MRDPRARKLVKVERTEAPNVWMLELECGHIQMRKYITEIPTSAICILCPPAGGLGGRGFGG